MANPNLDTENFGPEQRKTRSQFGYEINQLGKSVEEATQKGFELVQEVKTAGREIRAWANRTTNDAQELIVRLKSNKKSEKKIKDPEWLKPDWRLWEIAYLENEIARMIRVYFKDVSNSMTQLKRLNPPLNSTQTDPFLQAMLADRRFTLSTLEPLTNIIEQLTQIKSSICVEPTSSKMNYSPPL